jgi:hypothetical protein
MRERIAEQRKADREAKKRNREEAEQRVAEQRKAEREAKKRKSEEAEQRVAARQMPAVPARTFSQPAAISRIQQAASARSIMQSPVPPPSMGVATPVIYRRDLGQRLAWLKASPDRVADVQIVEEAYGQKILKLHEYDFYKKMIGNAGRFAMSPKQQSWLSDLNKKILAQLNHGPSTPALHSVPSPQPKLTLVPPQLVIDAFRRGKINKASQDFYLDLTNRKVTNLSDRQQKWVNEIHKKLGVVEDSTLDASSEPPAAKRTLFNKC